jgi:3-keto-5-aminohexanoate cleavage enzyme
MSNKAVNNPLPLIINLAPTGMVPTKGMSPHVPIQTIDIIKDVLAAAEIGLTMVHIHARDHDGKPTYKKEIYGEIIAGIRDKRPDLIIGVSCSGRNFTELEQRADVLNLKGDLRPDMASLTLSSLNFSQQVSINEPRVVYALAERMLENEILPEFEIFDLGMVNVTKYLIEKLNITQSIYANIILGNIATAQADLLSIATLTTLLPPKMIWSLGGVGNAQISMTALGAAIAPGVRIGLEDNLWNDYSRQHYATNTQMVERIHRICSLSDRTIMSALELRHYLKLKKYEATTA